MFGHTDCWHCQHFEPVLEELRTHRELLEKIMVDTSALTAVMADIAGDQDSVINALNDLASKLANNGDAESQAAINDAVSKLQGIHSALQAAVAKDDPTPTPAPTTAGDSTGATGAGQAPTGAGEAAASGDSGAAAPGQTQ